MILDDVVAYIDVSFTELTTSTNLFVNRLPDTPTTGLVVAVYEQPTPDGRQYALGGGHAQFEMVMLSVLVRHDNYNQARNFMEKLLNALEIIGEQVIGSTRYLRVMCPSGPTELQPDQLNRTRLTADVQVWKEMSVPT